MEFYCSYLFYLQMKEAAQKLNIKGHIVGLHPDGTAGKELYSPGDIGTA